MVDAYERMFGTKPKMTYASPIEKGDHPELDTSELLDMDGIRKYQSMIGALQWVVTIGRFDITTAVMTMSSFRVAPLNYTADAWSSTIAHTPVRIIFYRNTVCSLLVRQ